MVYWYIDYFTQFDTRRNTVSMFSILFASLLDWLCFNYILWDHWTDSVHIYRNDISWTRGLSCPYFMTVGRRSRSPSRSRSSKTPLSESVFEENLFTTRNEVNSMSYMKHRYSLFLEICTYEHFFLFLIFIL